MSNTFSNGCLGSHTDEERSEMRYVMRIAKSVSHQNFERILQFVRGVSLLQTLVDHTIPQSSRLMLNAVHRFPGKVRADEKTNLITDPFQCITGRTRDDIITRLTCNTYKLIRLSIILN